MVLYAQSFPQIEATYGHEEALSILSNCTSQVYFPPRDPRTAELVSQALGTRLEIAEQRGWNMQADLPFPLPQSSYSTRYHPALDVGEVLALPAGVVALFSRSLRHLAWGSQAVVGAWLPQLPPAPATAASPPSPPVAAPSPTPTRPQPYW